MATMPTESRVYLGKMPMNIDEEDLRKHLSIFGPISELTLRTGYAIVNFESEKDALDVVTVLGKRRFLGAELRVSLYVPRSKFQNVKNIPERTSRVRTPRRVSREYSVAVDSKNTVVFLYLNKETCWQQLKDFGRAAGPIAYCETSKQNRRVGFIKYETSEGAEKAIQELDGKELLNCRLRVVSLTEYDHSRGAEALIASRMRSRSPGAENRSTPVNMEGEAPNTSRRERRRINDDRRTSPVVRNSFVSGHESGEAPGSRAYGEDSGSVEPGELSENAKIECIPHDPSLEVLLQLTADVVQPSSAEQV